MGRQAFSALTFWGLLILAVINASPSQAENNSVSTSANSVSGNDLLISPSVIPLPILQDFKVTEVPTQATRDKIVACGDGIKSDSEECEFDYNCRSNYACNNCECVQEELKVPVCGNGILEALETCEFDDQCGANQVCRNCSRCEQLQGCSNYSLSVGGGGTFQVGETASVSASTTCTGGPSSEAEREDGLIIRVVDTLLGVNTALAADDYGPYIPSENYNINQLKPVQSPDCTKESYSFSLTGGIVTQIVSAVGSRADIRCLRAGTSNVVIVGDCSGKQSSVTITCQGSACGNGIRDQDLGEECDDGNRQSGDGCSATCLNETVGAMCGNNRVDTGEECDPPGTNCDSSCFNIICGDGRINGNEACDDRNTLDGDGCSAACQQEVVVQECGNNKREAGEQCDGTDTPVNQTCNAQCQIVPVCGNGVKEDTEQCDDGNQNGNDQCDNSCHTRNTLEDVKCASGYQCMLNGQTMNGYSGLCPSETLTCASGTVLECLGAGTCTGVDQSCNGGCCRCVAVVTPLSYCGDGNVDPGESCDDGNGINCDGCNNNCTVPVKSGCNLTCQDGNKEFRHVCHQWVISGSDPNACVCSNCESQACFVG